MSLNKCTVNTTLENNLQRDILPLYLMNGLEVGDNVFDLAAPHGNALGLTGGLSLFVAPKRSEP